MKKKKLSASAKEARRPKPHPPRKHPPKNNLAHVPALFRALGPNFRIPGRPVPRIRPPDSDEQNAGKMSASANEARRPQPHPPRKHPPKNNLAHVPALFRAYGRMLGPNFRFPGRPVPRIRPPDSAE